MKYLVSPVASETPEHLVRNFQHIKDSNPPLPRLRIEPGVKPYLLSLAGMCGGWC